VSLEVAADRIESQRLADEQIMQVREDAEHQSRVALGQSETRHFAAMRQMKLKFQQHLATIQQTKIDMKSCSVQTIESGKDMINKTGTKNTKNKTRLKLTTGIIEHHETLEELATKILAE
jgi:hypothetical protein